MTLKELKLYYGYVQMRYSEQDGLYYFQSDNFWGRPFNIATVTIPNLATPESTLPLIEFEDIVGLYMDKTLTVYDQTYIKPLEEKFLC